ncbi:wall-associated receptor kinase-like 20 [Cucurbita maxima]|uniref:Wall-associated receptor kinase-like 20 n=1 Tax=Cucurbita maxima TaxID=3661 RepID=A0A6J1HSJ0_CUCMA|nr:wall-associated receptor kinase-like 20 [Cucurbita maxima]
METNLPLLFLLILLSIFLSCTAKRCPDCGRTPVPYPLSTRPDCGDPLYRVRCTAGVLWFESVNGSSYLITSVNPVAQRLIIRPPGLAKNTCVSSDFGSHGFWLDIGHPFTITNRNTVLLFNCSMEVLENSWNCSANSVCHDYIKQNPVVMGACKAAPTCCWYTSGGSITEYRIRVRKERCSAYECFVNLGGSVPAKKKWPEPGVEIQWAPPREPPCRVAADCRNWENSACLPEPANARQMRCFCKVPFKWDPVNGLCNGNNVKIQNKRIHKKHKKMPAILGAMAGVIVVVIGGSTMFIIFKRRQQIPKGNELNSKQVREVILTANSSGKSARMFTTKEIAKATNNFSKENLLGSGGYGEVFKGSLEDGTLVAVKRAKLGCMKGIDQILNEVRILCQVNHRCLVRLLGCCLELEQPLLIYEYISNGNLFDHLHGNTSSSKWPPLTLSRRLYIARQTADGLAYLHTSAMPRIYHRDIKSSNILLDEKLNAKVADFGLSRLAVTESSHITTGAQGTLGYLDPEYYLNFQLTDKSDVYSFGVVMLELLTSEKAIDFNREEEDVNLVVYIKKIIKEDRLMEVVDPVIKQRASRVQIEIMKALGSLAAACLDEKRQNRPTMKEVADELANIICVLNREIPNIDEL